MKGLGKNVQNIKLAKADPQLAASSQCFMTTTQVSVQIGKVRKALGSIALAMSKGAQMVRAVTVDVFRLTGVSFLVKEAKHLPERAKTESVEKLSGSRCRSWRRIWKSSPAPMRSSWIGPDTPTPGQRQGPGTRVR